MNIKNAVRKHLTAILFSVLICIGFGVFVFLSTGNDDDRKVNQLNFSTSTPASDLSSNDWWDSIPTDPALPTMPAISVSIPTVSIMTPTRQP